MASVRKMSGASLLSRVTLGMDEEPNYEEMSEESLKECLEAASETNRLLALENMVFERYLKKHDPQSLVAMNQVIETAKQLQRTASLMAPMTSSQNLSGSIAGFTSIREKLASPSTMTSSQTFPASKRFGSVLIPQSKSLRITVNHRIEMASKEIEEMKKQIETLEQETTKKKMNLQAQLEEVELRIKELQEAKHELEENVVKKGMDPVTGKVPAEKLVKFIEDWIKASDRMIEKLRLKTLSLKQKIQKAKTELQQRQELGETLHPIDFQVLAIENEEYLKKIEEKNADLAELKKVTGRYNLKISNQKNKLLEQQKVLKTMQKDIDTKKAKIKKLKNEGQSIRTEIEKTDKEMADIKKLMEEHKIPDVLEFVKLEAELQEMKKTYKRLERRKKLQVIAVKTFRKHQKQLNHQGSAKKSSNSGTFRCPKSFASASSFCE